MSRGMDGGTRDGTPRDTLYSIDPLGVQAQAASQSEMDEYWAPPPGNPPPDPSNPPGGMYQDSGGVPGTWYSGYSVPNPGNWGLGCYVDGIQTSCERAFRTISNGSAWGVTLSLHGAIDPSFAPIVAGIRSAATSIDGRSTSRVRYIPVGKPGDPNGLIARGQDGSIISESAPVHGITGRVAVYDRVEVGAISGELVFGGGGQQGGGQQPVDVARIVPPFSERDYRIVDTAITNARNLARSTACDEAFSAYGIPSLRALLDGINASYDTVEMDFSTAGFDIFDGRRATDSYGRNDAGQDVRVRDYLNDGETVAITTGRRGNGFIFLGQLFFDRNSRERTITILHEALHYNGGLSDLDFGRTRREGSRRINEILNQNCR